MATATTSEADALQRSMREVRAELRENVQELVVNAREMADWTTYVRAYPWLCVGMAAAAGYFLIPQRAQIIKPDAEGLMELARRNKLVVKLDEAAPKKKQGLVSGLLSMVAGTVLQGGLAIATKQLSQALDAYAQQPPRPGEVCRD